MHPWLLKSIAGAAALSLSAIGCSSSPPTDDDAPLEAPASPETEQTDHTAHDHHQDQGVLGLVGTAVMLNGEGHELGQVTFTQTDEGVLVEGRLESLEPGPKGFHVHEFGDCEPPSFESAGGHFNPQDHPHGGPHDDPDHRHAGDFGNIEFDDDGVAEFSFVDPVITLGDGVNDVAGQSLIVHYEEDDKQTQPTGDAGPRAGCGIIEIIGGDVE